MRNERVIDADQQDEHPLSAKLKTFIRAASFPCVGAKSALAKGRLQVVIARSIESAWDDLEIHRQLLAFVRAYQRDRTIFQSFAVVYEGPDHLDETAFERHLWDRIQSLSDKDDWLGQPHDVAVEADPSSPHFALSFGGEAFFMVGLHPKASRAARRFETPVMIFNARDQFEQLRAENRYEKLRSAIIERDIQLSGSIRCLRVTETCPRHDNIPGARSRMDGGVLIRAPP
jgi:uncharacterized protein